MAKNQLQVLELLACVHVFVTMLYRNRFQAAVEIVSDLACYHFLVAAEVVADRFTLLSAHSRAPEQPSMIETAFLFLADSKTPNFKNELLCIPEYVKKSAK
ncbi:hypothetical protein V6N11_071163 [Hibiscus sabdariffa]|uniref:Uncharacterized protein n=1 Tax=Hibiscus sabdariffa TaxID=183260 RepID=A0ABR2TZA2_9ROSI